MKTHARPTRTPIRPHITMTNNILQSSPRPSDDYPVRIQPECALPHGLGSGVGAGRGYGHLLTVGAMIHRNCDGRSDGCGVLSLGINIHLQRAILKDSRRRSPHGDQFPARMTHPGGHRFISRPDGMNTSRHQHQYQNNAFSHMSSLIPLHVTSIIQWGAGDSN
jgi:hypothetical protein